MVDIIKKLFLIILLFVLLFSNAGGVYATSPIIGSPSYLLEDMKTGQILYESNADAKVYPASTTKILTAILAIEKGDLNQYMTASAEAVDPGDGGMNIGIMAGEKIKLIDLLNAMLIKSANETANIIAENICSTKQEFVDLMNQKAIDIGAKNTHFVNTNGMHDPNHYTTVSDMTLIARYAMQLPVFRDIVHKTSYNMPPTNKHKSWPTIFTTNRLHYYSSSYFNDVTGIKSGYTREAGNNLISSAKNKTGMELLAVVFGVTSLDSTGNISVCSKNLLEYGFANYSIQKFSDKNQIIRNIQVVNAKDKAIVDLITDKDLSYVLPKDKSIWNIEKKIVYSFISIGAPINKGHAFGYIEYYRNGISLGKVNLVASKSIEKSLVANITGTLMNFFQSTFVRIILFGFVLISLFLFILRRILRKVSRTVRLKRQRSIRGYRGDDWNDV